MKAFMLMLLLSGCATFTKPTNELRVTGYSGHAEPPLIGTPVKGDLGVAGCRVVQEGVINGCLLLKVAECSFVSAGCPDPFTPEGMR